MTEEMWAQLGGIAIGVALVTAVLLWDESQHDEFMAGCQADGRSYVECDELWRG